MTASRFALLLGLLCLLAAASAAHAADPPAGGVSAGLPEAWLDAWLAPAKEDRPLQIVHGIPAQRATPEGMRYYADLGLGGLVCNVDFREYLRSEEHWKTLVAGVESCAALGMVVWLYDEEGYPSGAAGGLVLQENPAFEALEMAFDKSRPDPFLVRPAYEHTHASNNFHAARRYINLIDDRAVHCFIDKTHKAYWERLQPHFGKTIRAAFTDEPSLIAINIGQLPDEVRKKVRVIDPVDESLQPLPRTPWCHDVAEQYKKRYGEDLAPHRRSLFEGQAPEDRKVRTQFWGLIADLVAERYFGALQTWCQSHGIASSGHSLWEEQILHHVALEGNGLKCLARMDIPGLDLLTSDPMAVNHSGWLTAGLPASAAMLEGRRRVMTEVSDFSQKLGGQGPVGLDEMRAAAAWQAAWGVTDFTLYYDPADRPAESHRAYCDFVGRVNAIVKPARREAGVLLYYPIHDLWAEYLPVAEPLNLASQSARARKLVGSFMRLGQDLQRSQIPFTLTDHEYLASARTDDAGGLKIAGAAYRAILLPDGAELPPAAARAVNKFKARGGLVLADGADGKTLDRAALVELLRPAVRLAAPSDQIALGRFSRDGRAILLAANVGSKPYQGRLITGLAGSWLVLNPADGSHEPVEADRDGSLPLALTAHETTILVRTSFLLRRSNP